MTRDLSSRLLRLAVIPLFLLTIATPAWSQDEEERGGFAKVGGYAGFSGLLNFTFDGVTFDGETLYKQVDGEELAILPKLDTQRMMRVILGYRGRRGALEVSYDRSQNHGTFVDFPVDTTYQAINVDGRFFFATRTRFQPHVLVGGAFPWLIIKDGSYLEPNVGDAKFRGYGVNTEAGVTIYPHSRVGVSIGYAYKVMWFDRETGVSNTLFELRPRFRETAGSVVVTGLFTF